MLSTGEPANIRTVYEPPGHRSIALDANIFPFRRDGRTIGLLLHGHVVTSVEWATQAVDEAVDKYRRLFETVPDAILLTDSETGKILEVNEAAVWLYGYTRNELFALPPQGLDAEPSRSSRGRVHDPDRTEHRGHVPLTLHQRKDGSTFPVEMRTHSFEWAGRRVVFDLIRDLSRSQSMEAKLREQRKLVAHNNQLLEQKNAALMELLQQLRQEKERHELQVRTNVAKLVLPHLTRLEARLPPNARDDLELAVANLRALTSPIGTSLSRLEMSLSPREVEVCGLIASGQATKDIARTLGITTASIAVHRRNIRRKLGLTGKGTNLASYLSLHQKPTNMNGGE